MTERIYYTNPNWVRFEANVVRLDAEKRRLVLDRTAFYPTSGGQPHDLGSIHGIDVISVDDEDDSVVHTLARPLEATGTVEGVVDWARRFDHMQQHTGQHLLSAVFVDLFGLETLSFHMGAEVATIELATPSLDTATMEQASRRANALIAEDRPVAISFEDAASVAGLRKAPSRTGVLRIVTIGGIDKSACGGTHVTNTAAIGFVSLRGTEKIRGNTRLEFVCGLRAATRASLDYRLLETTARTMKAPFDEVTNVATDWAGRLGEAEKLNRKLSLDLATYAGRDLYSSTEPLPSGMRLVVREVESVSEEVRAEAQSFVSRPHSAYIGFVLSKPAVLFATSLDSGIDAGAKLKELLTGYGGKGGGAKSLAQGSVPDLDSLNRLVSDLKGLF
ncbi:MAG: hypothetical protein H7039_18290 [Bryobacteraceae bacterium]|nr:hypothetical protein [Bryobacteraceae bacterium]